MAKLLRAVIRRYLHSITFWIAMLLMGTIAFISGNQTKKFAFNDFYAVLSFVINAIAILLLSGREHGDGGFRNKVICGHTKGTIFLSEMILGIGTSLVFGIVFFAIFLGINHYVFTVFPVDLICKMVIDCLLAHMCFAAMIVTICCWISRRAFMSVVGILLVFGMFLGITGIQDSLLNQKYHENYTYVEGEWVDENGNVYPGKYEAYLVENPEYIGGAQRAIYEVLYKGAPYGHILDYISLTYSWFGYDVDRDVQNNPGAPNSWDEVAAQIVDELSEEDRKLVDNNLIYSVAVLLGVFLIGYIGFRKKELK